VHAHEAHVTHRRGSFHEDRLGLPRSVYRERCQAAAETFWLPRKKFPGSYFALIATRRS
jgi:hypothetical protein